MTDTPLDLDAILANAEVGRATYLPHLDPLALRVIDRARKRAADDIPALVAALRKAEAEVERLRGIVAAYEEDADYALIEKAEAVEAESEIADRLADQRNASRTAHAALVADLRALHRPTAAVDGERDYDACVTCFDEYERPSTWPCATAALLDRHAPEEGR